MSLWSFTGVWVTESLLKSPGLFSVLWPFDIMLSFEWSALSCQLPGPPPPLIILLVTVPKVPMTIGIIVTFLFHSFFNSLQRSRYLSFFHYSFSFILWSAGTAKSTTLQILWVFFWFFLWICTRSGLLTVIRWSVCTSKSHGSLCVSFSRIGAGWYLFL